MIDVYMCVRVRVRVLMCIYNIYYTFFYLIQLQSQKNVDIKILHTVFHEYNIDVEKSSMSQIPL